MSRTYKKRHKKNKSGVKKAPPVSYKIARDLTKVKEPETKLDTHGNVIYSSVYIDDEKFEYWVDYNTICQPIHYHDSRGCEWWVKYNSKNNISEYWDNTGYEESYHYYAGNVVICHDSFGNKHKKIIDRTETNITREVFITQN